MKVRSEVAVMTASARVEDLFPDPLPRRLQPFTTGGRLYPQFVDRTRCIQTAMQTACQQRGDISTVLSASVYEHSKPTLKFQGRALDVCQRQTLTCTSMKKPQSVSNLHKTKKLDMASLADTRQRLWQDG
eukprot:341306-Amphidinium_carterae.1